MTRHLARARGLLMRGAWIDRGRTADHYDLRIGVDRRARPILMLDEATFEALIAEPGLRGRPGGGWIARPPVTGIDTPPAGSPGRIEGERRIMTPDGQDVAVRANLGESPIAWLARRRDARGTPWLSAAEVAAGERLRMDAEIATTGHSVTMRWDALPRTGGGSAARMEPGQRALAAGRRAAQALASLPPGTRSLVQQVCIRETSLQLAEREAGFKRREGKTILKAGLQALARFYGIG